MPGPVYLEGDDVTLRPVAEDDLAFVQRNLNDPAVWTSTTTYDPTNDSQMDGWYEAVSEDATWHSFMVYADDEPVGNIHLADVERAWGRAEVGVWVTPGERGQGYATEAIELVLDWAFYQKRFHKVIARIFEYNESSRRMVENIGFTEEGHRRSEGFRHGEYWDMYVYGILEDEWREARAEPRPGAAPL